MTAPAKSRLSRRMNPPAPSKFQFSWRPGNHFELLVDGHAYFPRMLEAVELARRYVLLEIYLFESGVVASRFIDALTRAAARGALVKVLVDDFGAAKLLDSDRERLTAAGVELVGDAGTAHERHFAIHDQQLAVIAEHVAEPLSQV